MARSKQKRNTGAKGAGVRASRKESAPNRPLDPLRTGMPALDSIIGVDEFVNGKKVLRIIHTKEIDEYEEVPPRSKRKRR